MSDAASGEFDLAGTHRSFAEPMLTESPGGAATPGARVGAVGASGIAPAEDQRIADAAASAHTSRLDR